MEKELEELRLATEAANAAKAIEDQARRAHTDARNRLNAAQRAIDSALQRMKASAPRESDWHEQIMAPSRQITRVV